MCPRSERLNPAGDKTVAELMPCAGCSANRNFIQSSTLKTVTVFRRASKEQGTAVKLITVHRCRFVCHSSRFRYLISVVVIPIFHMARLALAEERKRLSQIGS